MKGGNEHFAPPKTKGANIFFFLTFVLFFLSIALVRFMAGGVPVRSLFALFLFGLLLLVYPHFIQQAVIKMRSVFMVILYAAGLGVIVSVFNSVPVASILQQIVEIHFQAIVGVLTGYALLHVLGPQKLTWAFIWVVGLSSVFAVLQAVGVDAAWRVRETLQQFQTYDLENIFLADRLRAMGLSFTPVHLGTQLCLAFALSYGLRMNLYAEENKKQFQKRTWLLVLLALMIAIASGNRSPILGFVVFMAASMFYARPSLSLMMALFLLPIILVVYLNADVLFDFLTSTGLRAFRTGDKSSEGREALRAFGWLLFVGNPFGYGLSFSSTAHVDAFWAQLAGFENAQTIWVNAVHNYYLNVLHKYGILILPVAFFVIKNLLKHKRLLLAFVPYAVHIYYHNDGPLQSDFLIWYFVPFFVMTSRIKELKCVTGSLGVKTQYNIGN